MMDVGRGIIPEKIFENQYIFCRNELTPEKRIQGAILGGGTQGSEKGVGAEKRLWGRPT